MPRTVAVVTGTRAEYGILLPVLHEISEDERLALRLIVCGMHLSPAFGHTVERIEQDGIPIAERIHCAPADDSPEAAGKAIAAAIIGFADSFARSRPDILLLAGDRPEMLGAAVAALNFVIPVAHLHGGELTEGAVDDAMRHALTKLSHIHFVSTESHGKRVIQMGEDPARVYVTGAPALDHFDRSEFLGAKQLEDLIGMKLDPAPILCTFHPVTLELDTTMDQLSALLDALDAADRPVVFTYPNADPLGRKIIAAIEQFVETHARCRVVPNLGTRAYFSLMNHAAAMAGNSSSGIIEAASFKLPVVNIGSRQGGRVRAANVIDVNPVADEISRAIADAVSPEFRAGLDELANPYGDGHAAPRIVEVLANAALGPTLTIKRFKDLDVAR